MDIHMKEYGFVTQVEYGELHTSANEQHGFRPYQLMVASIAGCSSSVLRKVLTKMRLDFSEMKVSAEVKRNEAEANRIEQIHLHFTIRGTNLREDKVERALALSRKNCAMVQSVKDSIRITESFELV